MKKKYILSLVLAAGLLTSCDMNLSPKGAIDEDVALTNVNDALNFRNGFYAHARSITSSGFFTLPDLQCDMFNGLTINGNQNGEIANGGVLSSVGDFNSYWGSFYYCINNVNFFMERIDPVRQQYVADNNEFAVDRIDLYIAEGHFFRGYLYAEMFDRWCQAYTPDKANTPALGLPIVTIYNPTANRDEYKGRSTMKETIDFFQEELRLAYEGILAWETKYPDIASSVADSDGRLLPNATYISSWCCKALQARIALWLGDYANALKLSKEVIDSKIYALATPSNLSNLWLKDTSTEVIFSPYESTDELGGAIGGYWLDNQAGAAYIPVPKIIEDLQAAGYETDKLGRFKQWRDARCTSYFEDRKLKTPYGLVTAPCFKKFPSNPSLQPTAGNPNYVNKPKPFRLSEMYFIAAESAYETGDQGTANEMLKTYMNNRINYEAGKGYADLSGVALRDEIRKQRGLEFVGEGYRLSDLRRWKMGFTRANGANYSALGYDGVSQILTPAGLEVVYQTDDHRYTWPIPSTELQVNPQMAGQQNPGY